MYDVVYSHCIESLETQLKAVYNNLVVSKIESTLRNEVLSTPETNKANVPEEISGHKSPNKNSENDEKPNQEITEREKSKIEEDNHKETDQWIRRFGLVFKIPRDCKIDEYKVFYIGEQSLNLTNLIMTYNKCQFYTYNPATDICQRETLNINRALMKRYYMIQKAKDAQVVGIVVGTLGVANYLDIIERLKKVLTLAGKKFYTFVMGKLNIPKMANFMEIDVFVLVACPENTLIDSQEFFKPIVTPYEMEIACLRTQEWTGEYVTDFRQLLPGASFSVDLDDKDNVVDNEDCPDMSLITGQLRTNYKATTNMTGSDSTSVVERNKDTTISTQRHTTGAEFLASRSWKGLEQNLGQTTVSKTKQGRMGRASGYTHEENH